MYCIVHFLERCYCTCVGASGQSAAVLGGVKSQRYTYLPMSLQWNVSIVGTIGTQLAEQCREVSQGGVYHMWYTVSRSTKRGLANSEVDLGQQTVSSLERCPLFKVSFIERFQVKHPLFCCYTKHNHSHVLRNHPHLPR